MGPLFSLLWFIASCYVLLCIAFKLPPFRSRLKALVIGVPASLAVMVVLAFSLPSPPRQEGEVKVAAAQPVRVAARPVDAEPAPSAGEASAALLAEAKVAGGKSAVGDDGAVAAESVEDREGVHSDNEGNDDLSITVSGNRVTLVGLTHHNDGIDRRLTYRDPKVLRLTRDDVASGKWTIAEDSIDVFCFADGNNAVLAAISGRIHATNGKARQFTAFKDGDGVLVDDGELLQVHEPFDAPIALIDAARTAGLGLCGQKSIDQISGAANAAVEEQAEPADPEQRKTVALNHIALAILGAELCRYQVEHDIIAMHAALAGLNPSKLTDVIREPLLAAGVVLSSGPTAEICRDVVWAQYGSDGLGFVSR